MVHAATRTHRRRPHVAAAREYRRHLRRWRGRPPVRGRVAVRPSRLPGAGAGLFAARDFARGAVITAYDGTLLDHAVAAALRRAAVSDSGAVAGADAAAHVRTLEGMHRHLDGLRGVPPPRHALGLASYANDARGPVRVPGLDNNAAFRIVRVADGTVPLCVLRATRFVPRGAEVLVSYGANYWQRRAAAGDRTDAAHDTREEKQKTSPSSCPPPTATAIGRDTARRANTADAAPPHGPGANRGLPDTSSRPEPTGAPPTVAASGQATPNRA